MIPDQVLYVDDYELAVKSDVHFNLLKLKASQRQLSLYNWATANASKNDELLHEYLDHDYIYKDQLEHIQRIIHERRQDLKKEIREIKYNLDHLSARLIYFFYQDKRLFFRKIMNFIFKNLDDESSIDYNVLTVPQRSIFCSQIFKYERTKRTYKEYKSSFKIKNK